MADLDAFITVSACNGDTFSMSSNNDVLIYTENSNQNILIGNQKNNNPQILITSNLIRFHRNVSLQGSLDVSGTLTQGGISLGSKWSALNNTIFLLQSNVAIGSTRSNSLLTINDVSPITPSNASVSFLNTTVGLGVARVGLSNTGDLTLWHTSNNSVRIGTSNREVVTITETGRVGICNVNPTQALDVEGNINFTGQLFRNGTTFVGGRWSNENANLYVLESNVCVGISNSSQILHLNKTTAVNSLATFTNILTNSNTGLLTGVDSNGHGIFLHQNNFDLRFGTNNFEYMRIKNTGSIGINKTNPGYTFDVNGSIGSTSMTVTGLSTLGEISTSGKFVSTNVVQTSSNLIITGISELKNDIISSSNLTCYGTFTNCNSSLSNIQVNGRSTFSNLLENYGSTLLYSNMSFSNSTGLAYFVTDQSRIGLNKTNPSYTFDVNGSINATNLYINGFTIQSTQWSSSVNGISVQSNIAVNTTLDPSYALNVGGSINLSGDIYKNNIAFSGSKWTQTVDGIYTNSNIGINTVPVSSYVIDANGSINASNFYKNGIEFGGSRFSTSIDGIHVFSNVGIQTQADPIFALDVNGDINFSCNMYHNGTMVPVGKFYDSTSGIYTLSNVGINGDARSNYNFYVNGTVNVASNIYINGNEISGSRWTGDPLGIYVMSNVGIDIAADTLYSLKVGGDIGVDGDIIPLSNEVYNLGSVNYRFKDLYLSGTTIYLGDLTLKAVNSNGNISLSTQDLTGVTFFPPEAMTSDTTSYTGYGRQDGIYAVSSVAVNGTNSAYKAFNNNPADYWETSGTFTNNVWSTPNEFSGAGYLWSCPYIYMSMPNPMHLSNIEITAYNATESPKNIFLLGTNDEDLDYTLLSAWINLDWSVSLSKILITNNLTNAYKDYIVLFTQINSTGSSIRLKIPEMKFIGLPWTPTGFGVENPSMLVDINGNTNISGQLYVSSLTLSNTLPEIGASIDFRTSNTIWSGARIKGIADGNSAHIAFMTKTPAGPNAVYPSERMRLTSEGKLGIGKSNPSYDLDVNSNINFSGNLTKGGATFPIGYSNVNWGSSNGTQISIQGNTVNDKFRLVSGAASNEIMSVTGDGALSVINFVGIVLPFAGIIVPNGWVLCYGQAISRTTYANLFAALVATPQVATISIATPAVITINNHGLVAGNIIYFTTTGALPTGLTAITTPYYILSTGFTTNSFRVSTTYEGTAVNTSGTQSGIHSVWYAPHGIGDGSTTFNVPDLRGRVAIGKDDMGGSAASRITSNICGVSGISLGASGGDQRLHAHTHSITDPGHGHDLTHQARDWAGGSFVDALGNVSSTASIYTAVANTTGITINNNTQGGIAQNVQPSLVLNYIIKY